MQISDKNRIVALLGATGLVGAHSAFALADEGYTVRMACRSNGGYAHVQRVFGLYGERGVQRFRQLEWHRLDAAMLEEVEHFARGADVLVGAAARVGLNGRERMPLRSLRDYNARLTTNAVEACLQAGVQRLVHIGSIAALGDISVGHIAEDSVPMNPLHLNAYAQSKCAAEREVLRGEAEGISVCILNPGVVLAPPTRAGSSADLVLYARQRHYFYPSGLLAWVDVRDVAQAVVRAVGDSTFQQRCTLVGAHTPYAAFYCAMRDDGCEKRIPFRFSRAIAQWVYPPFLLFRALHLLPRAMEWAVVRSSLSEAHYACDIAPKSLGMSFRTLAETAAFCKLWPDPKG